MFHTKMQSTHITTNTTTNITGSGKSAFLHTICINTKGATANTCTVNSTDSAGNATAIAVIDTTGATQCFIYDIQLNGGLQIVTASGTAADLTVTWEALMS